VLLDIKSALSRLIGESLVWADPAKSKERGDRWKPAVTLADAF